MQFILSPLHKAINYDKSFAWFKNRLKGSKRHALKAQAPGASALSGRVKFSVSRWMLFPYMTTAKLLITVISRGNLSIFLSFPRLINYLFVSLQHNKQLIYRKI